MANTILPGYATYVGNKYLVVFDHSGPASYSQSAGDVVNAIDLGMGGFDYVETDMYDPTGVVYAEVVPTGGGGGNAIQSFKILWYAVATGTIGGQAQTAGQQIVAGTNLSALNIRVLAWCV